MAEGKQEMLVGEPPEQPPVKEVFVGIQFIRPLKIHYYLPHEEGYKYRVGDVVEVETTYGGDVAIVKIPEVHPETMPKQLRRIVRVLSKEEYEDFLRRWEEARSYIPLIREKVNKHDLNMHVIDAKFTPDNKRFVVFFSSETRVDFRKLVVDLARTFKMRIELYHIGSRDGAAIIGGIGPCGRELCCYRFLRNFKSISLNMLKEQDMQLNPEKMTGLCGRLKCCLAYELDMYREMSKGVPKVNDKVRFVYLGQEMVGIVTSRNLLAKYLYVTPEGESTYVKIGFDDVKEVLETTDREEKPEVVELNEDEELEED